MYKQQKPVELRYEDLAREGADLSPLIEAAFGADGLGILTVSGVPGVAERRRALLPLARRFALLPDEVKQRYEHAASFYSFGWSHGKEKLQGKPDTHKGSYYNNPLHDRPTEDAGLVERFPAFYHPNIWPREDDLPELEPAFKAMGRLIVEVGALVARQCDTYVRSRSPTYPAKRLEKIVRESTVAKGRLLHYFPMEQERQSGTGGGGSGGDDDVSTWCGWHNDHGSLTGLLPAMYLDASGKEVESSQLQQQEDKGSGLFALNRAGDMVQVVGVPANHLIFQVGETAEIHSGGVLKATPHAVKGGMAMPGVSRETFAVFMEPEWSEPMDAPPGDDGGRLDEIDHHLPKSVPPLRSRWQPGVVFADFTASTLNAYY